MYRTLLALCACALAAAESAPPTAVLLGATGNLAKKYLWQILFDLYQDNKVGVVIGGATKDAEKGTKLIMGIIDDAVKCSVDAPTGCEASLTSFKAMVQYQQVRNDNQYGDLAHKIDEHYSKSGTKESGRLFYLSVSPDFYPQIAKNINTLARPKNGSWMRVIFEKPFGRDFDSASSLAESLNLELKEEEIYRVDHYIGKRAVRDIGTFRQLNAAEYDKFWSKEHVESVEVLMKEKEDVEGRTWFYDNYGAVRDILQNHLTEVLAFAIGDLPESSDKGINRAAFLKDLTEPDLKDGTFLQYDGYLKHVQEDRKDDTAKSVMPTAASVTLSSKSARWAGVPIIMTHGKALDERVAFVRIKFKETSLPGCEVLFHIQGGALGEFTHTCNSLPSPVLPSGWKVVLGKEGGAMAKPVGKAPGPYYVLVAAALKGDKSLFCGTEELMELWRVWTPVLKKLDAQSSIGTYSVGDASFAPSSGHHFTPVEKSEL